MIKRRLILNRAGIALGALLACGITYVLKFDFIIPLVLLVLYAYLKFAHRTLRLKGYKLLHLTLLFLIIFTAGYGIVRQNWPVFYIPVAALPLLSFVLYKDPVVSLLLAIASSLAIASIAGNSYHLGALFLTSGLVAILAARNARRRVDLIRAGLITGFIQALAYFFLTRFSFAFPERYLALFFNGVISGFLVLAVLPVFEILFSRVTDISLLELADFNHPLLLRLVQEAPGTYHHSLVVGNLSDAACSAIGAHALLARVGAYYHDIGKLSKPEYFSENEFISASKHDTLSPTMSKLVIMNHVKEGVELAKRYKLSPNLVDFIQQHHGNSLVYYFYRRALETLEEDQEVKEEGFRYPGPRPLTRETAVVLLADSVEAASRALRDPSPARVEEIVHKVINNKFIDRQLDECDLTLKDLEKIAAVFIHILSGIYHSRITYPESPSDENTHKKPAG